MIFNGVLAILNVLYHCPVMSGIVVSLESLGVFRKKWDSGALKKTAEKESCELHEDRVTFD